MIPELDPRVPARELPPNAGFGPVRSGIRRSRLAAEVGQVGEAAAAEAPAADQAEFDFRLVEPTPMLGGEVHRETAPEASAQEAAEMVGERLLTMDVEVIHHQMNRPRAGVSGDNALNDPSELRGRAVGGGAGEMPAGLGFDDREDVRRPTTTVLAVAFSDMTRARRARGRTSAWRETGFSSRHTTGSFTWYGLS